MSGVQRWYRVVVSSHGVKSCEEVESPGDTEKRVFYIQAESKEQAISDGQLKYNEYCRKKAKERSSKAHQTVVRGAVMTPCANCRHSYRESRGEGQGHDVICFHWLAEKLGSPSREARLEFCEASDCFEAKEEGRS